MSCIAGQQQVLDFVAGTLDPRALDDVEQHLDACDLCRRSVAELARNTAPEDASPPAPKVGRYEILRPIGADGMGVDYLTLDPDLGRRVAL